MIEIICCIAIIYVGISWIGAGFVFLFYKNNRLTNREFWITKITGPIMIVLGIGIMYFIIPILWNFKS